MIVLRLQRSLFFVDLCVLWLASLIMFASSHSASASSPSEFPVRMQDNGTVSISAVAPSKELKVNAGDATADTLTFLGDVHTCAILDNDKVKCWGLNYEGGLGYGDKNDRGELPNSMGDSLPYVDLGTGRTAVAIGTAYCPGSAHTCAILDNDAMKCWGGGSYNIGQLGYGDTTSRGDGPNEMGDNLPYVDLGSV